ncbi:MAG: hypothetical protein HQL40_03410 [Alphaproteobacteria bacterium]|nr:hypothetical protein [Alphaproteobacteria bacterium]
MSANKALALAQAYLLADRPDLCLETCAPFAERDHAAALWLAGLAALAMGDFEAAERRIGRLRAIDPGFRGDPAEKARALALCPRPDRAEAVLRRSDADAVPTGTRVFMVESYHNLGNLLSLLDDPDNCVVLTSDTESNHGLFGDFLGLKRVVYYPRFLLTAPTSPQVPFAHDWPRAIEAIENLSARLDELARSLPSDSTLYWWAPHGAIIQHLMVGAFRRLGRETVFLWNPSSSRYERWTPHPPDAFGRPMTAVLERLSSITGMDMTVVGYNWVGREQAEIKSGVGPRLVGREMVAPAADWGALARRFADRIAALAPDVLDHEPGTVLLMGDDYALYRHAVLEPSVRAFNNHLHDLAAGGRTFHLKPHYNGATSHWICDRTAARALKKTLTANIPSELLMPFYDEVRSVSSVSLLAATTARKYCLLKLFQPDPARHGDLWMNVNLDLFVRYADTPVTFVEPSPDWP